MKTQKIIIIGGKGTAINIAEHIEDANQRFDYPMQVLGFAIDDPSLGSEISGFPVVCGVRDAWRKFCETDVKFLFALYRPDIMQERFNFIQTLGIPLNRYANFIHPSVYLSPSVSLGNGNVILSNSCLQHNVTIGNFNIINSNVVIEHDVRFQNGSFVAANACIGARVRVGCGTFIGLNSTVREDAVIADYAFIGMASAVLNSIDKGTVVFGVPAKKRDDHF